MSCCLLAAISIPVAHAAGGNTEPAIIVFIGDSLTQGYGVKKEDAYPDRVEALLNARGLHVKTINGGISASVSAEADRRVQWYLKASPRMIVLALGGNDALKGTPLAVIKGNLDRAIRLAQKNKVAVLLVGIRVYENLGPVYTHGLEQMFRELAKERNVPLMPFLLEDVALKKELNQSDMKHPNAEGHAIVAKHIAPYIEKILKGSKP